MSDENREQFFSGPKVLLNILEHFLPIGSSGAGDIKAYESQRSSKATSRKIKFVAKIIYDVLKSI